MPSTPRRPARTILGKLSIAILMVAGCLLPQTTHAAERPRLQVEDYSIHAIVNPQTHRLAARAEVKFKALEDLSILNFELHNALRVQRVMDAEGHELRFDRDLADSSVRVILPNGMLRGQEMTLTFEYAGLLASVDASPVPGLRVAYVGDPITVLLYAGRWFPVANYGIDRVTARIAITAPAGYTVVSSDDGTGAASTAAAAAETTPNAAPAASAEPIAPPKLRRRGRRSRRARRERRKRRAREEAERERRTEAGKAGHPAAATAPPVSMRTPPGMKTTRFTWSRPGFPGSVVMARFTDTTVSAAGMTAHVYLLADKAPVAQTMGATALKEMSFFVTLYGLPASAELKVVELPDDSLSKMWAPQMVGLAARYLTAKLNYRLLSNAVAHQWFGTLVSPRTRNDWWIQDGGARYSEARYIEYASGEQGAQEAVTEMEVGALAYNSIPLGQIGTLNAFDPVFQSMVNDKGGMIFHMLRWVMGDEKFDQAMRAFFEQYRGKAAGVGELQATAEKIYGKPLTWFFSEWLDSTGAPEFHDQYTVYRVAHGFRVVGQIQQDLDLFRMPVELRIDTDGKTVERIIDVVGPQSSYSVDTFGRPRKITLDPNNHILKNTLEMRMRSAILRGQQLVAQGDLVDAVKQLRKAIAMNPNSSLAHYRIADIYYLQKNYQAAADAYRDSLNGDGVPRWTEVWSHIQLGKIFDMTGQRQRAVSEYRQALQTNDNTQGALAEARAHLEKPYKLAGAQ